MAARLTKAQHRLLREVWDAERARLVLIVSGRRQSPVDALEAAGLVQFTYDYIETPTTGGRRQLYLGLTPAGRKRCQQEDAEIQNAIDHNEND